MNCLQVATINRRIRAARESARAGQCSIARRWLATAARDLKVATTGNRAMAATSCLQEVTKGAEEMLAAARSDLRRSCK